MRISNNQTFFFINLWFTLPQFSCNNIYIAIYIIFFHSSNSNTLLTALWKCIVCHSVENLGLLVMLYIFFVYVDHLAYCYDYNNNCPQGNSLTMGLRIIYPTRSSSICVFCKFTVAHHQWHITPFLIFELYPIQPPKQFVNACIIIVNDNNMREKKNRKYHQSFTYTNLILFYFIESKKVFC